MAADYKERKRELSVTDRLALCGVAVMGRDYAMDAYKMSHRIKTENPASLNVMVSRWLNNPKAIEFLNEVKQMYADTLLSNVEEGEALTEKQLTRIVERGIVTEKDAKKQADMSLKLMAWKKDSQAEVEEKDKRLFVLPHLSKCSVCKLMGVFMSMRENGEIDNETFDALASRGIENQMKAARNRQALARKRTNEGTATPDDRHHLEDVARIFKQLLTWEDVLDIFDYFSRMLKGGSDSVPHWKKQV